MTFSDVCRVEIGLVISRSVSVVSVGFQTYMSGLGKQIRTNKGY
jgi:hypothetical protein